MKPLSWSLLPLALLAASGCQNETANVVGCRQASEKWVKETLPENYSVAKFSSATLDTDDDGYVTAEVLLARKGDPNFYLIQLDCPTQGVLKLQKGNAAKLHQIPLNNVFPGPDSKGPAPAPSAPDLPAKTN